MRTKLLLLIAAAAVATPVACKGSNSAKPAGDATSSPAATASASAPSSSSAEPMTVVYRWSGGFSVYQYYVMTIHVGADSSQIEFKVKPFRGDEKSTTDTLDADQTRSFRALFDQVGFDKLGEGPRPARIMDIGESRISKTVGGTTKELFENGTTTVAGGDIAPLRDWFDQHTRLYLQRSGARPAGVSSPAPSPSPSPAP